MVETNQIRVGLIGCGYQGQWLARAAARVGAFRVVALVDPDSDAAAEAASAAKDATIYPSSEEMLEKAEVGAVFIATPHHLLQPYALQAIKAGKHVLAEKPIALNTEQALELEKAVEEKGAAYMSGYSFRYFEQPANAKRLLTDGVLGEIQTISAGIARPSLRPGWPTDPDSGGGILGFYGCHMVDRVLWYVEDKPVEVFANVSYYPDIGVDQTSVFQVLFKQGVIAQFNISGTSDGWFDYAHINGHAGHMALSLASFPNYSLTVSSTTHDKYDPPKTFCSNQDWETSILNKMTAELDDFAQAIEENHQPPITVADGRKVLEVLDAVIASGKTGQPVSL
jgi:predicted dehydrogenase